jgi:hypothetical protein
LSEGIVAVSQVSVGTKLAERVEQASSNVRMTSFADLVNTHQRMLAAGPKGGTSLATDTLADQILSSVEQMSKDYHRLMDKTEKMLEPGPAEARLGPSSSTTISNDAAQMAKPETPLDAVEATRDILAMQFDIGRLMVHEQLVSSAAGRSNQNLDTLLRGQ